MSLLFVCGLTVFLFVGCDAERRVDDFGSTDDAGLNDDVGLSDGNVPCAAPSAADDIAEAKELVERFAVCRGLLSEGSRAVCEQRDVWLLPPEYGPDGTDGPWTVGRPVADCALETQAGDESASLSLDLPPVILPPLQATWRGAEIGEACADVSTQVFIDGAYASIQEAEEAVHRFLTCTGAGPEQQIVDCWGPLVQDGDPQAFILCRLQNLADDYAYVASLGATSRS